MTLYCRLAFERLVTPGAHQSVAQSAIFLHGILGSKRNWRGPARECLKLLNGFEAVLVDHRGHGDSLTNGLSTHHTVENCSLDLLDFTHRQQVELFREEHPTVIVAHSFGGKVALQYLALCEKRNIPAPKHTFILDSLPGQFDVQLDLKHSQSVSKVMNVLLEAPPQYANRNEAIDYVTSRGIALPIAQWLATSLIAVDPVAEGSTQLKYCYDLQCVSELFQSYARTSMWNFLQNYKGNSQIHFVRAEKNGAWTSAVMDHFASLQNERVSVELMPKVGHWLHAENPLGLAQLIARRVNS